MQLILSSNCSHLHQYIYININTALENDRIVYGCLLLVWEETELNPYRFCLEKCLHLAALRAALHSTSYWNTDTNINRLSEHCVERLLTCLVSHYHIETCGNWAHRDSDVPQVHFWRSLPGLGLWHACCLLMTVLR